MKNKICVIDCGIVLLCFALARRKFFTLLLLFVFVPMIFFFSSTFLFIDKISINIPVQVYFEVMEKTKQNELNRKEKKESRSQGRTEVEWWGSCRIFFYNSRYGILEMNNDDGKVENERVRKKEEWSEFSPSRNVGNLLNFIWVFHVRWTRNNSAS